MKSNIDKHLKNEIYLWLEENFETNKVKPENIQGYIADSYKLSGFDAMMVYLDWTLHIESFPKDI